MREALRIARHAEGRTSPNPLVGAVVVRDGKIIAEGWHRRAGTAHAEIHALNMAGELAAGATLYVTLEPCSHFGRTPPCARAIVEAGIKKVVAAMSDPNPLVAGRGFEILRAAGVEVEVGVLEAEARALNEIFIKWVTKNLPFVTMKFACSLDGKIATVGGESKWISGEASRKFTHHLRDINDAILVGVGTVLKDNPSLTTRLVEGKNPVRVIVDSNARTPLNSTVVTDKSAQTIIAVTSNAPNEKISALKNFGVEIIFAGDGERVDLKILMSELARREITSVLVEGGGTIHFSMLKEKLVDKIFAFVAPKILGGENSLTAVAGAGFEKLSDAVELKNFTAQKLGEDFLLSGYVTEV
ncbi:MAG: bifunctional diaminohydroxyphosphoribosylaminopyrimidine deaminase/5-amino-6-(5-phosphoribosylamino)uracil reductase RibD [Selenomonadaceae bacterium]|nr:bifunctional diaminohydroxyphosphoribosylaminopyrimidine deaminase/5-amino-6-(5-phosphoribosylamino)uracil reductase RibD [Selenomonadaceae bacterium]MBQ3727658.1 bifunctional diaminohydroxyphosphoribosylaminopyrimidine deaminase/5-amino-6-(5-phosphoribosylamino)uracil reductase RibD [Selenomonadaceae bacterium]MBQ9496353.1 bifunctional diaminohydroxyphosphoribosylaminopyrimidine deaminase/5-amino-6-(5-phosphoribosylamino)uracil reductase RibD [Selenomonadaceae bacterium]